MTVPDPPPGPPTSPPKGPQHDTPPGTGALTLRTVDQLAQIDRAVWDQLANPNPATHNPFISWDFLQLLEETGCVSPETGWTPMHLVAQTPEGAAHAAAPAYLKSHSQGEFVFDHAWAHAFEQAGGRYYPKLLVASPFSPVTGPRLLTPDPALKAALLGGIQHITEHLGLSSAHITFPTAEEWALAETHQFLQRGDQQFMWFNRDYQTFDDFLAALNSRKRKNLKKERAAAQADTTIVQLRGDDITPQHWDVFYAFYIDTGARKWGTPYLNRDAFALLHQRMADQCLLILAYQDDTPVAGALHLIGGEALLGRYWGTLVTTPFLHFELCYYQAIDFCIEHGLARAEAGAQGGHKMARGYEPTPVYSAHHIVHTGFRAAVDDFLAQERQALAQDMEYLAEMTPFKKANTPGDCPNRPPRDKEPPS